MEKPGGVTFLRRVGTEHGHRFKNSSFKKEGSKPILKRNIKKNTGPALLELAETG